MRRDERVSSGPVPARARGVASRVIAGEAVVIVPSRSEVHALNESGSAVWALADGTRTRGEISREIAERYGVPGDAASADVETFLADLASRGAVESEDEVRDAPPASHEMPAPGPYSPPGIAETQKIEVVAALCSSLRESGPKPKPGRCRTQGACQKPFE